MCMSSPDYDESPGVYEKKLMDISQQRLNQYNQMYLPAENQYMRDTRRMDSDGYSQLMTDKATNSARLASPVYQPQAGSGSTMKTAMTSDVLNRASQMSLAASTGNQVAAEQYYGRNLNTVGTSQGQAGTAMQTTGNVAANQAGLAAAQNATNTQISGAQWNAAGAVAGAGFAYGNYKNDWFPTKG